MLRTFLTLVVLFALAPFARASETFKSPDELRPQLRGGVWAGTFTVLGLQGRIRIQFSDLLNANGDLQYTFRIDRASIPFPLRLVVENLDTPCPFTPRALHMVDPATPDGSTTGTISIYACEKSEEAEARFTDDFARKPKSKFSVNRIELSKAGQLVIDAGYIGLTTIHYELLPVHTVR